MSASSAKVETLRFAIMVDGDAVPSWAAPILAQLTQCNCIEAVALIYLDKKAPGFKVSSIHYMTLFNAKLHPSEPIITSGADQEWVNKFEGLDVDFVLSLTPKNPPARWLATVLYGFWRYRFGDTCRYEELGVAESCDNSQCQKVVLEKWGPVVTEKPHVIFRGYFKFNFQSLAYHRKSTIQQCASWPVQAAQHVIACDGLLHERSEDTLPRTTPIRRHHKMKAFFIALSRRILFQVKRVRRQFTYQQWNVGTIALPIDQVIAQDAFNEIRWWPPPESPMCLADPFPLLINNKLKVFAEQFSYVDHCGAIVSFDTDSRGLPNHSMIATALPFHISYPCVIQDGENIYATFEMLEARELVIYRCTRFSDQWEPYAVIATDQAYSDPTIFKKDGRWWVFATRFGEFSEGNTSLHAWYSEHGLGGPWQPHARNPIKIDIRSSRSAGTVFQFQNKFYRPAQNCVEHYGRSIVVNEIRTLDPQRFSETIVREILPEPYLRDGIHHIAGIGNWTLVDGRRDQFSLTMGFKKFVYHFRRIRNKNARTRVAMPPKNVHPGQPAPHPEGVISPQVTP